MSTRYQALFAVWLFQIVNYLDRTSISFAGPTMMKSMGLDAQDFGVVLSSFAVGYLLAQIPGGILTDRWGTRVMFVVAPLLWAACTGGIALAAGVVGVIVARVCLGLAEGISNAAIFKLVGDLFPSRDRARIAGLWATSFAVAPALGGPLVAFLLITFDWRMAFVVLAVPALAVAVLNYLVIPGKARSAAAAGQGTPVPATPHTPFSHLVKQPSLWFLASAYMFFNVGYWGYNGWMPSYLAAAHHIDLKSVGLIGGIPYVSGVFGLLGLGWIAGAQLYAWRPQLWAASFILAGGFLYGAFQAETIAGSLVGLSGAAFFLYGSLAVFGGILIDYAPEDSRASFAALATTAGQAGGVVAPLVIGYLVEKSGGYGGGFAFMIVALVIAAAAALGLATVRPAEAGALAAALPAPTK
jgi:sugar phosphate permease